MQLTCLVENLSRCGLTAVHGLSLYIQTDAHRLLFDLGPDNTLFQNAAQLGIDLAAVDTVILSHGHDDHGGPLPAFLEQNHRATVYVQRTAFQPHFSATPRGMVSIGLDPTLMEHPQVRLLDGDAVIDEELTLFTVPRGNRLPSPANAALRDANGPDTFAHEQNLILSTPSGNALIMGCGHRGVVNILNRAEEYSPRYCVGGFHLYNPATGQTVPDQLLDRIADELGNRQDMAFYTCHCTGPYASDYLSRRLPNLHELHCGDTLTW